MAYKPIDRSYTSEYLKIQHQAMCYLASLGLTDREIREFSWVRSIDPDNREIVITRKVQKAKYYSGIGRVFIDEFDDELHFPILGSGCEDFFLRDKFISCWMFTREKPRSWRREVAKSSLYSLSDVAKITSEAAKKPAEWVLTKTPMFGKIRVTKLNITNSKAKEQGKS